MALLLPTGFSVIFYKTSDTVRSQVENNLKVSFTLIQKSKRSLTLLVACKVYFMCILGRGKRFYCIAKMLIALEEFLMEILGRVCKFRTLDIYMYCTWKSLQC